MKLWAGRISEPSDKRLDSFNSSISFDCRMYKQDIEGSIAHATMLSECGIIGGDDCTTIIDGLHTILADIESGELPFDPSAEDIHMFIEAELTDRVGIAGKRLHTARSRNDQVALDLRLYLRDEVALLGEKLEELVSVLMEKAKGNLETIMPGYTHLQRAQPVTFAHHLLAYGQMFLRDMGRLHDALKRLNSSPLGCGALATTTYPINRERAGELLGFDSVMQNSLDGVSDRDYCVEIASALSLIMTHMSRFSEEIILWCSWEFQFVELDDRFSTGSSIMPQKKNPDIAELVRGKTGRVYGDLMTLLTVLKGLPLAYNKDMQEDKEAIFDALDTVNMCLEAFTPMIQTMKEKKDNMRAAAAKGFINATDCADYLTKKGLAFRDAYQITGVLVAHCIKTAQTLESLSLEEYQSFSPIFENDIFDAISLERCVKERCVTGGPAKESVLKQIAWMEQQLSKKMEDIK